MYPTVPAFLLTASSLGEVTVCLSQDLFSLSSVLASPKRRKEAAPEARAGCRRNEHDSDARRFELILASYAIGSMRWIGSGVRYASETCGLKPTLTTTCLKFQSF
jgi:hypothetical protein